MSSRYDIKSFADELDMDMERIAPLFSIYLDEMSKEILSLEEYLHKQDWNMLERVVHNIKGVSANLNIYDVYEVASDFDKYLKGGNTARAMEYLEKIKAVITDAEIEIKSFFAGVGLKV